MRVEGVGAGCHQVPAAAAGATAAAAAATAAAAAPAARKRGALTLSCVGGGVSVPIGLACCPAFPRITS
eukprot:354507-Chlamydomonas_euryale.AAC.5